PSTNCESWETHFTGGHRVRDRRGQIRTYAGDSAVLAYMLGHDRYDEVWLWSGGGEVIAGIGIGRLLRARQATVRVPDGATCASSCTIAFMGGLFRYLDIGSKYLVHSASGYMDGLDDLDSLLTRDTVLSTNALQQIATEQQRWARFEARQLTT